MIRKIVTLLTIVLLCSLPLVGQTKSDSTNTALLKKAQQKLSLDVKDADIRDVVRMISKGYGLNIILDKSIKGTVTLHLTDTPIHEALEKLVNAYGWKLQVDGSVYRILEKPEDSKNRITYARGLLSVDADNLDIKDFVDEVAAKSGRSIIAGQNVTGKVRGTLRNAGLEEGLKLLLDNNGFILRKSGNIYSVVIDESTQPSRKRPPIRGGDKIRVDYFNGKLSITAERANLADVINAISARSQAEIVIYGNLSGNVNAILKDISLTEGLALLLGGTKFTFVQQGNVILIGDRNTATPSGQTLSKSELVHLRHIKADEVPKILPKNIPAANIKIIKEQNALLVSGTSEDIVKTRDFLKTVDIPTPQVLIDVLVVEYTRSIQLDAGISMGVDKNAENIVSSPGLKLQKKGHNLKHGFNKLFDNKDNFITRNIGKLSDKFYVNLQLLEANGKAKVLAQPSITVLNGNKATINIGQTQYYSVTGGTAENPTTNFRPINFGIQLRITPWISKSGQITAEINPEISNAISVNQEGYPDISKRSISTTVRIDDNKTIVLGGLLKSEQKVSEQKIPILGSLPILGYLFKRDTKVNNQTNLVIYITPHIIDKDFYVDLEEELTRLDRENKNRIFTKMSSDNSIFIRKHNKNKDNSNRKDSTEISENQNRNSVHSDEALSVITDSTSVQQNQSSPQIRTRKRTKTSQEEDE